jgi:Flp pilus assembly protein TadG
MRGLVRRRTQHRLAVDAGAAVVEFVMISVLLVVLLLGVVQVAVYFYVRNIVAASAAAGARFAAAAGVDPRDGGTRAQRLLAAGVDSRDAAAMRCAGTAARDRASGLATTQVHCTGRLRLLFLPLPAPLSVDVTSSVLTERAP